MQKIRYWAPNFLLVFQNRVIQTVTSGCLVDVLPVVANDSKEMLSRSRTGVKKKLKDLPL